MSDLPIGGFTITPVTAIIYSFVFGLLHGVIPDEHTWPITFSYAIGGANGKEGMRAGLFFSAAFTVQRMIISELAYFVLAPFFSSSIFSGIVDISVGIAMSIAGVIVLRQNRYAHLHVLGHHHEEGECMEMAGQVLTKRCVKPSKTVSTPPIRWTIIHGFIAGFGFGGFSVFINTVAAPAMKSPFLGFLPGLLFGVGTMIMLVIVGGIFGASLRWTHALTEQETKQIGAKTGGRTLFFGGLLFATAGITTLLGLDRYMPIDTGYLLIGLFMLIIAVPAFIYSLKEILAARRPGAIHRPN